MDLSSNQNKLEERLGGASLMRLEVKEFFENIKDKNTFSKKNGRN